MRVLYLTTEPELAEGDVVTGNALRARQLTGALRRAGHDVETVWPADPTAAAGDTQEAHGSGSVRGRDALRARIARSKPGVILVGYWELLGLLPFDLEQPLVLDFVAPRPLEALYESPAQVAGEVRRLRAGLRRCDRVLVGNERQRRLLLLTLIEAGFDLRGRETVLVVPLGAECVTPAADRQPGEDSNGAWQCVTGGVRWPWRHQTPWLEALAQAADGSGLSARIINFEGPYRAHADEPGAVDLLHQPEHPLIEHRPLLPYREYSTFLTRDAHIGVELADCNIEREHSQSFRSLDFLRHGLPLLCNEYLPIASLVGRYGAGWRIDTPGDLREWARALAAEPEQWRTRSQAALALAREALDPDRLAAPLLDWLQEPHRTLRLPPSERDADCEPVLGVPPLAERLKRQWKLVRRAALLRMTGLRTPGNGVVFVTRSDLFPPDHGAAVRTVETARALGRLGVAVGIVTDSPGGWYRYQDGEFKLQPYPVWHRLVCRPAAWVKLMHYSSDLPLSNSFLYLPLTDRGFYWRILTAASSTRAGVLQAEFPAYAQPCLRVREAIGSRVVLVEHNVEYERLRSQVGELSSGQYQRLRAIEIDLCNRSDAVVCVSDNDRQRLIEDGVEAVHMTTIPHGVRLDTYAAPAVEGVRERYGIKAGQPVLAFHGTFSYPPNRKAIAVFADTLLPALERAGLEAHVLAIGREPPPTSPHPRIHFTGSVADVAPWLKAADLAVVPLTDGGGTRMKIVDCFAAGLPVISTSKGIEGIPAEPGLHALVIDDWDEMTAAITRLWRDQAEREALAASGGEFAARLDWSEIARRYRTLYATLG
ncbi:glycosyltransferase [Elongatibacter sediminis]|uniref:Glycosyltransferase n=1 Tax=Elongatibacter sediminis TaxID=3119006 RepID=A0AAW9RJP0_9GAMM